MPIGSAVRRLFGPYEHWVAEAYRRIFIDLDDFADLMKSWVPHAERILEVGCGEGAMTERLVRIYPNASVTAIDITPKLGRLYRGPAANVTFLQETVETVAARKPAFFDLIAMSDVLHHVPLNARQTLMKAIEQAMTPNGNLIVKDWLITNHPIHWACESSDRFLTGDEVSFFTMDSIHALLTEVFAPQNIRQTRTVRPWKNNVAALVQRSNQPPT